MLILPSLFLQQKANATDIFKVYKREVGKQLEKKIKIVGCDHGVIFMAYDTMGQNKDLFANNLENCSIQIH